MEIVDTINADEQKNAALAAQAFRQLLNSSTQRRKLLLLTALECSMKNCSSHFHNAVLAKGVVKDVARLAISQEDSDVNREVVRLIQHWALELKNGDFRDTYDYVKAQGVLFPVDGEAAMSAPIYTPPRTHISEEERLNQEAIDEMLAEDDAEMASRRATVAPSYVAVPAQQVCSFVGSIFRILTACLVHILAAPTNRIRNLALKLSVRLQLVYIAP